MIATLSSLELAVWCGLCVVFVLVSGLFSGAETGLYCLNATRLRLSAHEGKPEALRLQSLLTDRTSLLFTTLVGTNLANYLAPVCLTFVFLDATSAPTAAEREHLAELYTTLILTPIMFIFAEIVPKNVFQRNADRMMSRISAVLRAAHILFQASGMVWLQQRFSELVLNRFGRQAASGSALHARLDVYQMLREGAAEGALSLTQQSIVERIGRLKTIRVRSIMVPRAATVMLPEDATCAEVRPLLEKTRYSRLPVYAENRGRVVGVVHLLDLLDAEPDRRVGSLARPPLEITQKTVVRDALATLQQRSQRMAIIVDRSGRCQGTITLKDLVEEVVGELAAW